MRGLSEGLYASLNHHNHHKPMTTTEACRSLEQAKCELEHIQLWHEVHQWAEAQLEPKELSRVGRRFLLEDLGWANDQDQEAVAETIRDWVFEDALEIQVRSGWCPLGETSKAEEFFILLCTGGPAVRIRGELSQGVPDRCWLQHQDWGTSWTDCCAPGAADALLWYASQFCWREG